MRLFTPLRIAVLAAGCAAGPAGAQLLDFEVIAGEASTVLTPDLPIAASRVLSEPAVGDAGGRLFGFRVQGAAAVEGYWASTTNGLKRYAAASTTGAAGPGRNGAEAAHVFLTLTSGGGSIGPDGQRAFAGRAGDPAATATATWGLWRWDGSRNIEFARGATDGVLGPNLGSGWVFANASGFADARMLDGGRTVFVAEVRSPANASSRIIGRHLPGSGNQACMRTGATEPLLAPGLTPGDSFAPTTLTLARLGANRAGQVYARLPVSGSREGIFELCNGAPRAIAADNVSGPLGPDIDPNAFFTGFASMPPQPSGDDGVVFVANWRVLPGSTRSGVFRHDGVANRALAYNEPSGFHGPNWQDATWASFDLDRFAVAGETVAFVAGLGTVDGAGPTGVFRVRAGERPEPAALVGIGTAPYAPEPGRTWRSFEALAVFGNGDIVLDAATDPGATRELWMLRRGQAPRRLLSPGQPLRVPTPQGLVQTTVFQYTLPYGAARPADGSDDWVALDGTLLVPASAVGHGKVLISARVPTLPPGVLHRDGFE